MPAPSAGGVAPAAGAVAAAAPAHTPPAQDQFGLDEDRNRHHKSETPTKITAHAVAATSNGLYWTVRLDNGGVWRTTEHDNLFRPPAENQLVKIRKSAMGGYLMNVDKQQAIRVERID
jgi:hypothetical protein